VLAAFVPRETVAQWAGARRPHIPQRPGPLLDGELIVLLEPRTRWRQLAQARVWAHLVEVASPALDDHLGLGARAEPFQAQALVAELAVEALSDAIPPGFARLRCRCPARRSRRAALWIQTPDRRCARMPAHHVRSQGATAPRSRAGSECDRRSPDLPS
jgi:hypothetical protein